MPRTRILVVEDDAIIAAHIGQMLERMGYDVLQLLASGEDALASMEKEVPDVVLMDVRLRGKLNGMDAGLEAFRKYGVGVVFSSAFSLGAASQTNPSEPFGYVTKPVKEEELDAAIKSVIEVRNSMHF